MRNFLQILFLFLLFIVLFLFSCGDPYKEEKKVHRFFRCELNSDEWSILNDEFKGDVYVYSHLNQKTNTFTIKAKDFNEEGDKKLYVFEDYR